MKKTRILPFFVSLVMSVSSFSVLPAAADEDTVYGDIKYSDILSPKLGIYAGDAFDYSNIQLKAVSYDYAGAESYVYSFSVGSGEFSELYTLDAGEVDTETPGTYKVYIRPNAGKSGSFPYKSVSPVQYYDICMKGEESEFEVTVYDKDYNADTPLYLRFFTEYIEVPCDRGIGIELIGAFPAKIECEIEDETIAKVKDSPAGYVEIWGLKEGETTLTVRASDGRTTTEKIRVLPPEDAVTEPPAVTTTTAIHGGTTTAPVTVTSAAPAETTTKWWYQYETTTAITTTFGFDTAAETTTTTATPKADYSNTLTEFLTRIAGWQNAALDECYILSDGKLLMTPDKVYRISHLRYTPYRVHLTKGTTLDTKAVLTKWKEMLREAGYPEGPLSYFTSCTLEEAEDGYYVKVLQDAYMDISLTDCLQTFPQVERIDAQFGYRTDSRPNSTRGYMFTFTCDRTPTAVDFPQLENITLRNSYHEGGTPTDSWYLAINPVNKPEYIEPVTKYEDYYAAMPYILSLDFVHNLSLVYVETCLADANEDAQILEPEFTVLFDRAAQTYKTGDVRLDGSVDVADAVMLARFCAEDAAVTITETGQKYADANADGSITIEDVTAILRIIAKL